MTAAELGKCVDAFRAYRSNAFTNGVTIDAVADQVTMGFRLMPNLTREWIAFRRTWDLRLRGFDSDGNPLPIENAVVDPIEQAIDAAYRLFDIRRRAHAAHRLNPAHAEREAFKAAVLDLIKQLKDV